MSTHSELSELPYALVICCTWTQSSFMQVSGSNVASDIAGLDSALARDGAGRLVMRGTGIAGALGAIARRIDMDHAPEALFGNPELAKKNPIRSRVYIGNAHTTPESAEPSARASVAIQRDTAAAAEHLLFTAEVLPPGTQWSSVIGLRPESADDIAWLLAVLHEAEAAICFGRDPARGMGWCSLAGAEAFVLSQAQRAIWPRSDIADAETATTLEKHTSEKATLTALITKYAAELDALRAAAAPKAWWRARIALTITVGKCTDGYGLEALEIGAHSMELDRLLANKAAYKASMLQPKAGEIQTDLDRGFPLMEQAGTFQPYIPGSSIRGPMRALAERLAARKKLPGVLDDKAVLKLFGTVKESAALLIRDGMLVDNTWQGAQLSGHTEDEFSAGTYGSNLFQRLVLIAGVWKSDLWLEAATKDDLHVLLQTLEQITKTPALLTLGAGKGQPAWAFDKSPCITRFGGVSDASIPAKAVANLAMAKAAEPAVVGPHENYGKSPSQSAPNISRIARPQFNKATKIKINSTTLPAMNIVSALATMKAENPEELPCVVWLEPDAAMTKLGQRAALDTLFAIDAWPAPHANASYGAAWIFFPCKWYLLRQNDKAVEQIHYQHADADADGETVQARQSKALIQRDFARFGLQNNSGCSTLQLVEYLKNGRVICFQLV